jgi:hypothetical protein
MVEFLEAPEPGPEPESEIPAFLRKQAEDGNIKMEDRMRKHLFAVPDQLDKPRKKVFPSKFTESKEFTVPEVEIPEFLMNREQVDDECEGTYDEDSTTSPSW